MTEYSIDRIFQMGKRRNLIDRIFLENIKMASSLSKILETGIKFSKVTISS